MNRLKYLGIFAVLLFSFIPEMTARAGEEFHQSDFMNRISIEDVVAHEFTLEECEPPKKDDAGHYQSGFVFRTYGTNPKNLGCASQNIYLNSENGCIYMTQKCIDDSNPAEPTYAFYVYVVSDKSPYKQEYLKTASFLDAKEFNLENAFVDIKGEKNGNLNNGFVPVRDTNNVYMFGAYSVKMVKDSFESITTNLPIFHDGDTESIQNYIDTGSTDGAVNNKDVTSGDDVYDSGIEPPRNLRVSGEFGNLKYSPGTNTTSYRKAGITYTWNYPADCSEYKYDVQMRLKVRTSATGGYEYTDWVDLITAYDYPEQYDLNTGEPVSMDSGLVHTESVTKDTFASLCKRFFGVGSSEHTSIKPTFNDDYMIDGFDLRVRHRKGNGYSMWVDIHTDSSGSRAYATDDKGNWIDDNEYNGSSVDADPTIASDGGIDVNGFISYIRNGFGLLGNGGLISLMSGMFLYIPNDMWTLIRAGIAVSIVIMLFTLVKRAIFG